MYARHRPEFSTPQSHTCMSEARCVEPWDVGQVRHIAERARSVELRRLVGRIGQRLGDLALSRRRWTL